MLLAEKPEEIAIPSPTLSSQVPSSNNWSTFLVRRKKFLLGLLGVAIGLGGWQLFAVTHIVNPIFTSYPTQIVHKLISYFNTGTGWRDLRVSATELAIGFGITLGIGIPLGVLLGWYKNFEALLKPAFDFFYNTPRMALAPLFVVWFGLGLTAKVVTIIFTAIFPIIISAQLAVATTDRIHISMARSFGAGDLKVLRLIVIPGAVAPICAGIRIGIQNGLGGFVLAEFIASNDGLGYTINFAATTFNVGLMFAAVTVVATLGILLTWVLRMVERRFDKWRL